MSSSKPTTRLRRWSFRLLAIVLGPLLFFGGLELVLNVIGTGHQTEFLVCDPEDDTRWLDNADFAKRFFPAGLERTSQPITIAKEKSANTVRIVVFGGSAAMGDPEPAFGMPRMLETLLAQRHPGTKFEVINTAMTAINSHVILEIARNARQQLDADLWIVYAGNNEVCGPFGAGSAFGAKAPPRWVIRTKLWISRTRTGQLLGGLKPSRADPQTWGGLEMFLDKQVPADSPQLERVYQSYRANLQAILKQARKAETPVVLSNVAVNLRSFPPFISAKGSDGAQHAFDQATTHLANGDEKKSNTFFENARDLDALRLRADTSLNAIAKEVAEAASKNHVHFVDAVQALSKAAPHGITGDELVYEHVHLTFEGNYSLAKAIAGQAEAALELPAAAAWPGAGQCAQALGYSAWHRIRNLERTAERMARPPYTGQSGHAERMEQLQKRINDERAAVPPSELLAAVERLKKLTYNFPNDYARREQFADLLEAGGDAPEAIRELTEITKQLPHRPEVWYKLGALQNRTRQWSDAESSLRQALNIQPRYPQALNSLGICLSHQQRFEESLQQFATAVEIMPKFAQAYFNWGLVLAKQDAPAKAAEQYQAAIAADPDYLAAHQHLGEHFTKSGAFSEAAVRYGEVVRLAPDSAPARINLAAVLLRLGKPAEARPHLEQALVIAPDNATALQLLDRLEK